MYWRQIFIGRVFLLEEYGRAQSSSVSPRGGGYCSSASTPHSSNGGSYVGNINGYGSTTPTSTAQISNMLPGSPSTGIFNSTASKLKSIPKLLTIQTKWRFWGFCWSCLWKLLKISSKRADFRSFRKIYLRTA